MVTGDGAGVRLQTRGGVVGCTPETKYVSATVEVPAGAELYLFSDGVFEIERPDGTYQLWEEFAQYLQKERPSIEKIVARMRDLHGVEEFDDDFSLLQVRMT